MPTDPITTAVERILILLAATRAAEDRCLCDRRPSWDYRALPNVKRQDWLALHYASLM